MHGRSVALGVGLLVAVVGADIANAHSDSMPLRVSNPVFNVPITLNPEATIGSKYTYNFCVPVTGNACGGPSAQGQVNPSGGKGGPYVFTIKSGAGFLPKGLALGPRTGVLTGTPVKSAAKNGQRTRYRFTVCTSDRSGQTCWPTILWVNPPLGLNNDFVGTWKGTYTRITSDLDRCGRGVVVPNRAVQVEIEKSGDGFAVVIRYYEEGIRICQGSLGENGRIYLKMAPAIVATSISGSFEGQDFVFTLEGQNTIIGTGQGWWGGVQATFNRG